MGSELRRWERDSGVAGSETVDIWLVMSLLVLQGLLGSNRIHTPSTGDGTCCAHAAVWVGGPGSTKLTVGGPGSW